MVHETRPMIQTFIELFAGIGFMRLALEECGYRCVFANEICPKKCKVYNQNFDNPNVICDDIRNIPPHKIPKADLATISFPCTDVSVIQQGGRSLHGSKSSIIWFVLDLIQSMGNSKPKFLLIENVVGLLTANAGCDIKMLLQMLEKIGYSYDVTAVNAIHFVPQTRDRIFIFAIKSNAITSAPVNTNVLLRRSKSIQRLWKQMQWSLLLPLTPPPEKKNIQDYIQELPEHSNLWFDEDKTLYWLERLVRPLSQNQRYYVGRRRHNKVHLKKESYCLLTSSDRLLVFDLHERPRIRYMTVNECLMLQGVVRFDFAKLPTTTILSFIGDAVCVPAVRYVIEAFTTSANNNLHYA